MESAADLTAPQSLGNSSWNLQNTLDVIRRQWWVSPWHDETTQRGLRKFSPGCEIECAKNTANIGVSQARACHGICGERERFIIVFIVSWVTWLRPRVSIQGEQDLTYLCGDQVKSLILILDQWSVQSLEAQASGWANLEGWRVAAGGLATCFRGPAGWDVGGKMGMVGTGQGLTEALTAWPEGAGNRRLWDH